MKAIALAGALALVPFGCARSEPDPLEVRSLSSSAVFIGVVDEVSVKPVVPDFFGGMNLATIHVEKIFGSELGVIREGQSTSVLFRQHMSHWVDFQVGGRYLVFMALCASGPQIVGTIGGATRQPDQRHLVLPNGDLLNPEIFKELVAPWFSEARSADRLKLRDLGCGENGKQI